MQRFKAFSFVTIFAFLAAVGSIASPAIAQDDTGGAHPVVGSWMLTLPDVPPAVAAFHDDGTYVQQEAGQGGGVGVWEEADDGSVNLTVHFLQLGENGEFGGVLTIRATVTVDDAGDSWTAEYTVAMTDPDGSVMFATGPMTSEGARISVETIDMTPEMPAAPDATPES